MNILIYILLSSIAIFIAAYILPGVHLASYFTAVIVAVVLGIINSIIRPILFILTLPINILTLGLFTFVIMGALVMRTSAIVPGFKVDSFWWAMGFAIVLWIINSFLSKLEKY
ncbi:MAG: phage holin family protein [Parachlamydia sp.]|nr:phage holin family protein [Parachlamydia sp.]